MLSLQRLRDRNAGALSHVAPPHSQKLGQDGRIRTCEYPHPKRGVNQAHVRPDGRGGEIRTPSALKLPLPKRVGSQLPIYTPMLQHTRNSRGLCNLAKLLGNLQQKSPDALMARGALSLSLENCDPAHGRHARSKLTSWSHKVHGKTFLRGSLGNNFCPAAATHIQYWKTRKLSTTIFQ